MTQLYLSQIRLDGGTQPRSEINAWTVQEYADAMANGDIFPPVTVFYDGAEYWLADGFHRYHAKERQETNFIDADVRQGTREDAVWFACGANATHGLRRTNADKRRAVETALRLPKGATQSDRQVAQHCGVTDKTVAAVRAELKLTAEFPQSPTRTGADGRTINTTNIGTRPASTIDAACEAPTVWDYAPPIAVGHVPVLTGEVVPREPTVAIADVQALIASKLAHQAETIAHPFAEYLEVLNRYQNITDPILDAWFASADEAEWNMCQMIFAHVNKFFARVNTRHTYHQEDGAAS